MGLRTIAVAIALLLPSVAVAKPKNKQVGYATKFGGKADKHRGGASPCLRPPRPVERADWGVAHRSWKCGTKVKVCLVRTGKCVVAPVIDRGPYGANLSEDEEPRAGAKCMTRKSGLIWCVKKKRSWPGTWRGVVDLSHSVSNALGHKGREKVRITRLKVVR